MEIKKIGVIGAGQMGGGIAQVAAQAGLDVIVLDAQQEWAEKGVTRVRATLDKLVQKGKLERAALEAVMARIRPSGDYALLGECDFVIEAATEKQDLKIAIFKRIDEVAKPGAILASNTSSISITLLGAQTRRPER